MNNHRLITWITFLAIFAMAARVSLDNDTWWHLRAGEWMIGHRQIVQADPFSYPRAGQPWLYPGWLVQVPMALLYRVVGPAGLNLWTAGMVTLAFVFVWKAMPGWAFLRAFAVVFGALVSGVYWAARPYLVTFVLAAVFLWVLEDFRFGRRDRLWALPALMVVWVNSHGGFAVGFILWGVYLAGRLLVEARKLLDRPAPFRLEPATRKLLLVGGALALAVLASPAGPAMLLYPFETVGIQALRDLIQEWQSPNFHLVNVQAFAWLLLAVLGAVGASRRGLALEDFLLVGGFAYLGLLAGRNVALFALVAPVVLQRHAEPTLLGWAESLGVRIQTGPPRGVGRAQAFGNALLLGLVVLAVLLKVSLILPEKVTQDAVAKQLPVGAVAYLREASPPGRLFNAYNWGGYLIWALPQYPVFVDGRTDLYDDEIIGQFLTVARGEPGWAAVLDQWDVRLVLVEPGFPLVPRLELAGWRLLYRDGISVVYGR